MFRAGFFSPHSPDLAHYQDERALEMAAFADAVRLGRLGERVTGDRGRPNGAGLVKLLHAFEMGAVARDARTQQLDIGARRLKAGRRGRNPDQPAAGFQDLVGAHLHLAADRVEYDIAARDGFGEILLLIVDDPLGAERANIIVIASAGGRDDGRTDMLGELDRKTGNAAGAALDQDCLAALHARGVFQGPDRGEAGQGHRGGFGMAELCRFFRDERALDLDLLGIAALDPRIHDAEHRIADLQVVDTGAERADDAGEIAAEDVGELELARGIVSAAAEPHLVVGGVDARGVDIDDDLARPRDRVRRVAVAQHLRPAMRRQQYRLHGPSSAQPVFTRTHDGLIQAACQYRGYLRAGRRRGALARFGRVVCEAAAGSARVTARLRTRNDKRRRSSAEGWNTFFVSKRNAVNPPTATCCAGTRNAIRCMRPSVASRRSGNSASPL